MWGMEGGLQGVEKQKFGLPKGYPVQLFSFFFGGGDVVMRKTNGP